LKSGSHYHFLVKGSRTMHFKTRRLPSYRLHKPSGQARVIFQGQHIYLGKFGTPESWEKYHRLIAEKLNGGGGGVRPPSCESPSRSLRIQDLILGYWRFAEGYYKKNGKLTGETNNIRAALRPLRRMYGSQLATDFGPNDLELVRQSMIDQDLSRNVINARIGRIKRMFRWASKKQLVPPSTYHGLQAVEGLLRGRSRARETEPVARVTESHVTAVLPRVTPHVRAMIQVQELAGMRPQDIRNMRTCDLDVIRDVWVFTPPTHKTEHHGHVRRIAIGPKAQAILKPFLKPDQPTAYVFSPREAVATSRAERRQQRKTPLTPSQRARKPKRKPLRTAGEQYTKTGYEGAIARGCKKAAVPRWGPNRLRHNCATKVRKKYGIEAAAAVLGNSLGMVAEVYAETVFEKAIEVMREIG
jgi:integrase